MTDRYTDTPPFTGHEIKARRLQLGLTRRDLLDLLDADGYTGWSITSIAGLERNNNTVTGLLAAMFHRAFDGVAK